MNNNWAKILLFSLLFLVLGFVLGRMCGTDKCGPGGMRGEACMMHGGEACKMGKKGKCCSMKGDSTMDHHAAPALTDSSAVQP
ncbi:MAG: hypothetical protein J5I62_08485 [Flavobacteriales bacterium]|nr:hypothetical protein [Flavobacteriales bacterium]